MSRSLLEKEDKYCFSFPLGDWSDRVAGAFLLRPLAFTLVMLILGGYIAFQFTGIVRLILLLFSTTFILLLGMKTSHRTSYRFSFILGVAGFALSFLFFSYTSKIMEKRKTESFYSGNAKIISNNASDEGYKNLILKLNSGEKVIFLTDESFEYGEMLSLQGMLVPIIPKGNPGDMDFRSYYYNMGIVRQIEDAQINSTDDKTRSPLVWGYRLGSHISRSFYSIWRESTDPETAMILAAMIVGDDSHLTKEIKESFQNSNLAHLLVVSGAHVGYFAATFGIISSLIMYNEKFRKILLSILLVFFGFVSGWSGPAARSILTYLLISFLSNGKRSVDRISACACSAVLLFLTDPYLIFSSGMILSFMATFSILFFQKGVEKRIRTKMPLLPTEISRSCACFVCAQFGMMPIMLMMGNSFSLPDFLVVLFAGFPAETICGIGLPLTGVCTLIHSTVIRKILFVPVQGLTQLLVFLALLGADRSVRRFSVRYFPILILLAACFCFLGKNVRSGLRKKALFAAGLISFGVFALQSCFYRNPKGYVYFMDVGQGDCALIVYNNTSFLIDGGRPGSGQKIENTMEYLGIDTISVAFATHLDVDHIGGIIELWENNKVECIYAPFWARSEEMDQLDMCYSVLPSDVGILRKGDRVVMDEDFCFEVLWPMNASDGGNDDSLVLLMRMYAVTVLFTGDISSWVENKIDLQAVDGIDVLKVSHHGSKYSSSESFLDSKKIGAVVISVGYNLYGHPSPEVIDRLDAREMPYYRTDRGGCVLLSASKKNWSLDYYFS